MRYGSKLELPNRFESTYFERTWQDLEWDLDYQEAVRKTPITYFEDTSESVVSENRSPDVGFNYSINPYRGCIHGCSYCYARPTHEFLGFSAGREFETKILVKLAAAELFRKFLCRDSWIPELIAFSGVTDCYQPAEQHFRLTRECLDVALEAQQPIGIVTKNALVVRDASLLSDLAKNRLARVTVSVTTLDPELARRMEPKTSIPQARLRAIQELTNAGIPVRVNVAPVIPELNSHEIPGILAAARSAGAIAANMILLRLPLTVEPVFRAWLNENYPNQSEKVLQQIRQCRDGKLNESKFGSRMKGSGAVAEQIRSLFQMFSKKLGFESLPALNTTRFRAPDRQRRLF